MDFKQYNRFWNNDTPFLRRVSNCLTKDSGLTNNSWEAIGYIILQHYIKLKKAIIEDDPDFQFSNNHLIDFGCGGGSGLSKFSSLFDKITGIDISKIALKEARKKLLDSTNKTALIHYNPDELDELAVSIVKNQGKANLIICTDVIQYIQDSLYIKEIISFLHSISDKEAPMIINTRFNSGKSYYKEGEYSTIFRRASSINVEEFSEWLYDAGFNIYDVIQQPGHSKAWFLCQKQGS